MLTWAGIVGGVFVGLWLLTWVVQLAAYAMFAVAWVGWLALRLLGMAAMMLLGAWWALLGSPEEKLMMRRAWALARRTDRSRPGHGLMRAA